MRGFVSAKITKEFYTFLKKFQINRIKSGNSNEYESMSKLTDLVVLFFKKNTEQYNKLLSENKNVR